MSMRQKIRIGVLFGGRSAEHEVSLVSATSVIKNLDRKKYQVVPIGITKSGEWVVGNKSLGLLKNGKIITKNSRGFLTPEPWGRGVAPLARSYQINTKVDVIFSVLHGTFGEDGTVQGLLELANIPYVGAGVLGSAVGMDKIIQKMIFKANNLPTPNFLYFMTHNQQQINQAVKTVKRIIKLPCFVKPANLGSSVGISKAHNKPELVKALKFAFKYDRRVIVEQSINNALEIECSVLGNERPKASIAGQIIASNEFYDYDAKYIDGKSKSIIPAPLPKKVMNHVRSLALKAFQALDLAGLARVDFLVTKRNWKIYLNEVNTIPGFTSISMYPKLWQATGIKFSDLLDELIKLAIRRGQEKSELNTNFKPKKNWFK